jgi:hypothetical protein
MYRKHFFILLTFFITPLSSFAGDNRYNVTPPSTHRNETGWPANIFADQTNSPQGLLANSLASTPEFVDPTVRTPNQITPEGHQPTRIFDEVRHEEVRRLVGLPDTNIIPDENRIEITGPESLADIDIRLNNQHTNRVTPTRSANRSVGRFTAPSILRGNRRAGVHITR